MRAAPLLLLLLVTALAGCTSPDDVAGHTVKGIDHRADQRVAPDFTVTAVDGTTFTLSEQEGKVVLVYFMGLSCTGCRANLPDHKAFAAAYANESRLVFLGLNSWTTWCGRHCPVAENETNMRAYIDDEGLTWPLAIAPTAAIEAYDVRGTPAHFFIDHEGREHGYGARLSLASLREETDFLLAAIGT